MKVASEERQVPVRESIKRLAASSHCLALLTQQKQHQTHAIMKLVSMVLLLVTLVTLVQAAPRPGGPDGGDGNGGGGGVNAVQMQGADLSGLPSGAKVTAQQDQGISIKGANKG